MFKKSPRIVSFVPSWTETLLRADLEVVGRTRFCIHPRSQVELIPAVGGTKDFSLDPLLALKPDIVLLDREENRKEMADKLSAAGIRLVVSHVRSISDAAEFLKYVGADWGTPRLTEFGQRYENIAKSGAFLRTSSFWNEVLLAGDASKIDTRWFEYVIWKNPFMVIGQNTFIADVLRLAGLNVSHSEAYPQIQDHELRDKFCLFSSEPYPFQKHWDELTSQGYRGVVVDGEKISWYGIRNLTFLESCLE